MARLSGSDPDKRYSPTVPAEKWGKVYKELGGAFPPHGSTERIEFEKWWSKHALTLNQRATLVWDEIAWAGWFARSEIAEGKSEPTIFPRKEGE